MTTINAENAKQIRKPMEVYVRMDLSDKSITMTYSGYSSAKIADGKLDQTDWKMRKITDLQGDGYPLDSSCTLYNPSTAASASNGKIGVRGDIGEPVSVTITGSAVMDSATIMVTGASSVSHDGGTSAIIGSSVIVSIEDSSATLTFTPKSADRRVEISDIIPGIMFNVTNENMISCTLSLRADLSIIDPTLPESEMNLEFYNDEDISAALAIIPEDTPITYTAGYDGDLSPERRFYIADQVTYKDNVVSVHAVDAVHFLDVEINPFCIGDIYYETRPSIKHIEGWFSMAVCAQPTEYDMSVYYVNDIPGQGSRAVTKTVTARELLAFMMNFFHIKMPDDFFDGMNKRSSFWPAYVDAGIPSYRPEIPEPSWGILEQDCANIERNTERVISVISADCGVCSYSVESSSDDAAVVGSGDWIKGSGVFLNPDDYVMSYVARYNKNYAIPPTRSDNPSNWYFSAPALSSEKVFLSGLDRPYSVIIGRKTLYENASNEWMDPYYGQVLPWVGSGSGSQQWIWTEEGIEGGSTTVDLLGSKVAIEIERKEYSRGGSGGESILIQNDNLPLDGVVVTTGYEETYPPITVFPDAAIESLFNRSPNTGSFTWKGDPRMQPRDVFTFVKLDGTEIDCTIEQIDLEHVGGGTTAKITYREGIV